MVLVVTSWIQASLIGVHVIESLFLLQTVPEGTLTDLEKPGMDEEPAHVQYRLVNVETHGC